MYMKELHHKHNDCQTFKMAEEDVLKKFGHSEVKNNTLEGNLHHDYDWMYENMITLTAGDWKAEGLKIGIA